MNNVGEAALHCHVAVGAAVSKGAPLFFEGDEVPHGHHGVVRHVEVEQLHAGEGFESAQLARRAGEVFGHEEAICGEQRQTEDGRYQSINQSIFFKPCKRLIEIKIFARSGQTQRAIS